MGCCTRGAGAVSASWVALNINPANHQVARVQSIPLTAIWKLLRESRQCRVIAQTLLFGQLTRIIKARIPIEPASLPLDGD